MTGHRISRRRFVQAAVAGVSAAGMPWPSRSHAQPPGARPKRALGVAVLNPRDRTPVGLIIDDSTCLVNLAHFGIPQFQEVFPNEYRMPWRELPREIPDAFVRKFGEWCSEHGVKGKYSQVPYPACVGRLDDEMPGWTRRELESSIALVRDLMTPAWDIHPEMVTHTRVIDIRTGRPYRERGPKFMENWGWTDGKSADEIASYMVYALEILKNVGFTCAGITTPGGFGNQVLPELARATLQACRSVFRAEIPHYFRHLYTDERSVAPRVEYASGLSGAAPECVVSIIGCTGDWFGGWDGLTPGSADLFLSADGKSGRLAEVIARGEPAIMVGHWPGFYFNGKETGFNILKETVHRLSTHYDNLIWMKLSEIARYWAARELTSVERTPEGMILDAPFACPEFTIKIEGRAAGEPRWSHAGRTVKLDRIAKLADLSGGKFVRDEDSLVVCFELAKGRQSMTL